MQKDALCVIVQHGDKDMKNPSNTAAELEASIKVEMEDICAVPTDLMISVHPDGDGWRVRVVQEGSGDDRPSRTSKSLRASMLNII